MAEIKLTAAPVLGTNLSIGTNTIQERDDLALVSIATPLDQDQDSQADLARALSAGWGLDLPAPTRASSAGDAHAIQTTADQMLLIFPHEGPDGNAVVQSKLDGAGYTTEQTDVWLVLEIAGPETLAALERLCPMDLRGVPDGTATRTVMEHMGALVLRHSAERFWLLTASSSAGSFLHAVEQSYRNVT